MDWAGPLARGGEANSRVIPGFPRASVWARVDVLTDLLRTDGWRAVQTRNVVPGARYGLAMTDPLNAPELDYAFLAEFARVEGDSLTAIGASYTRVAVRSLPATHTIFVAGRVRAPEGGETFELGLGFGSAGNADQLRLETSIDPEAQGYPYSGRIGLTFAVGFTVQLEAEGLHEVEVFIEDERVRRLAFDVVVMGDVEKP